MLGAFHSPDGRKLLPLALYRSGKVIRLYAPYLPRVSIPGKDRDSETRLMLQLQAGATYTPDPHITDGFCRSPARLCGYPAQFMAALPSSELHPALLIAGYLQHGSIFAPTQVALRAYGLHYVQQRIRLGPHSCLFYQAGEQVAKSEISLEIGENVVDRMRQSWTPKRDLRESVIC
jgi:hypothetical protein